MKIPEILARRRGLPLVLLLVLACPLAAWAQTGGLPALTSTPGPGGSQTWTLSIQTLLMLTALTFLTPRLDGVIFSAEATLWQSLTNVASGAVPEALLTMIVSAVMLALLPGRFKQIRGQSE